VARSATLRVEQGQAVHGWLMLFGRAPQTA
jgi:hypothetical protein